MSRITVFILLTIFCSAAFCNEEPIEEGWISKDIELIAALGEAYQRDPASVVPLLNAEEKRSINIGYGYSLNSGSIGGGYVSTFYTIIYQNSIPVSYELRPQMPRDPRILERYKNIYAEPFEVMSNEVAPLYHNKEVASQPLDGCELTTNSIPASVADYMSPFSGVVYGDRGGASGDFLANRKMFLSIKNMLSAETFGYLLCSKNPATRFTAAEYFYANKEAGKVTPEIIESIIEKNYIELPRISTMIGCMYSADDSRSLVKKMAKQNVQ